MGEGGALGREDRRGILAAPGANRSMMMSIFLPEGCRRRLARRIWSRKKTGRGQLY